MIDLGRKINLERNRILVEWDIDAAVALMGPTASRLGVIVWMHKARINLPHLPEDLRQESLDWLRANGFKDYGGSPLPARLEDLLQ